MFEIEDIIDKINKKSITTCSLSYKESREIEERINEEMKKVNLEYRIKQAQSIERAKRAYITF